LGKTNEYDKTSDPADEFSAEGRLWEKLKLREGVDTAKDKVTTSFNSLSWARKPFPYQREGIRVLLSRGAVLLADDMGLGKTLQAIGAVRILVQQKRVRSVLVIVPAGLISQWRKEIRWMAPELILSTVRGTSDERAFQWQFSAHIYLTSYETLQNDFTPNPQSPPRRRIWDLVILDEAQKIKNRKTETARKCKRLPRRRAWALTGTPLENCPDDLASILEFTQPGEDGKEPLRIYPGSAMQEIHGKLQLRRKKAEVLLELPPKIASTILLPLLTRQRESYDKAEKEGILLLKEKGEAVRISNVLELILRLKQICNFCPVSGESSKLDDIEDKLQTLADEGHRAIIFSQFTSRQFGVNAIYRNLWPLHPLIYSGDMNARQRDNVINLFREDTNRQILILSLRAGGQGLNLQNASYVFHFDRWWNPAVERQAEDRSHRLGQTSPVHVYKYTCENTIEERIEQVLQKKQQLFDDLVDDVSLDIKSTLSEAELFGLFGLKPPTQGR
jgi:SNF2 family DNA or RNA helicase